MKQIILASTSPRRKALLKQIGLNFKTVSSNYEEDMTLKMKPTELAKFLSKGKADAVKKRPNQIIISADTFITFENKILGKPHSLAQAKKTLQMISGKTLHVITGFTILDTDTGKSVSKSVTTKVYIKKLEQKEISSYIKTKEPLDKAGAFGIQEKGAVFVRKIEGDYNNVVGLPIYDLVQALKKFDINIF